MSRRMDRVNVLLRQEISSMLTFKLKDPRLHPMVSITRVETSSDLRLAKVFVSVLGDEQEKRKTLKALKSASGFIRRSLRPYVSLKTVPSLNFFIDHSIEQGDELLRIIKKVAPGPEADPAP